MEAPTPRREIAICVIWRGQHFLVGEGYDRVKEERFYRPLGGAIEAGESPEAAVIREITEELGQPIEITRHLGHIDSRFLYEGQRGWELVHVYEARFVASGVDPLVVAGERWTPRWVTLDGLDAPLYPEGLAQLLERPNRQ